MDETRSTSGESPGGSYGTLPSDTTDTTTDRTTGTGSSGTSSFGTPADTTTGDAGQAGQGGREWLGQLQGMIDNLATQAAPVVREIAAKAAELAAAAGEKAGPIAHKAADVTGAAGAKLAERGRVVASDLRRGEGAEGQGAAAGDTPNTIEPGAGTSLGSTGSTYPSDTTRTVGE